MEYNFITNIICPHDSSFSDELLEMSSCGEIKGLYIVIWKNDGGWIPHFHIYNNQNPKKATFDACLKIETPEYFKHGHHTDVLNSKQMKLLLELLNSNFNDKNTYWEMVINNWNLNNSKQTVPFDLPMPDYMSLIK